MWPDCCTIVLPVTRKSTNANAQRKDGHGRRIVRMTVFAYNGHYFSFVKIYPINPRYSAGIEQLALDHDAHPVFAAALRLVHCLVRIP